jgi:predicted AlkP superfamily pyrophosphatase or phosphodiesterase
MAHATAVINVVGLSESIVGEHTPRLKERIAQGGSVRLQPTLPAVTTSVQSTMLTGAPPREHGIVANGWYHRDLAEVRFWHRSNHLVQSESVWETARRTDPDLTCANLFWWYNTYSSCDQVVQVRPIYKADGRKIPDCYTTPETLRHDLQQKFGQFPLFRFWGPAADRISSDWIVSAARDVHHHYEPDLTLVYLPHMDYSLQKFGPGSAEAKTAASELDEMLGTLFDYFDQQGTRVVLVSEYGIEPVSDAIAINRTLREAGALRVREEDGRELMDPGGSDAFAVADHQVAHVYVNARDRIDEYRELCRQVPGVEQVLDSEAQRAIGLDHQRSGDLVLVAEPGYWFSYDYWLEPGKAPDFAPTVDINRKPGYDPRELFIDPKFKWPRLSIGWRLLKKKLGLRTLMDVIALDPTLVKGSHGRTEQSPEYQPLMVLPPGSEATAESLPCQSVRDVILRSLFDDTVRAEP